MVTVGIPTVVTVGDIHVQVGDTHVQVGGTQHGDGTVTPSTVTGQ